MPSAGGRGDRFECAVASLEREESLFATATPVRRWLLIEVRGAWGRDCVRDSDLADHVDDEWRARIEGGKTRIVAVRRDRGVNLDGDRGVRLMYVISGEPGDLRTGAWSITIDGLDGVRAATEHLPFGLDDAQRVPSGWAPAPAPIGLVCTNGRHDSCCATYGRPLVRALRESRWAHAVWESSHIGGDRFAANVVMLPEGLYYGRVTPDDAEGLFEAYEQRRLVLDLFRGRSASGFVEQAAEHFVRQQLGLDEIDAVDNVERDPDDARTLIVRLAGDRDDVAVRLHRTMSPSPTPLTCKGADGLSYPTYRAESIAPLTH